MLPACSSMTIRDGNTSGSSSDSSVSVAKTQETTTPTPSGEHDVEASRLTKDVNPISRFTKDHELAPYACPCSTDHAAASLQSLTSSSEPMTNGLTDERTSFGVAHDNSTSRRIHEGQRCRERLLFGCRAHKLRRCLILLCTLAHTAAFEAMCHVCRGLGDASCHPDRDTELVYQGADRDG